MAEATTAEISMPKHGEFCWNDLATTDIQASQNFYAELLGWKIKEQEAGGVIYNEISLDGQIAFGGVWKLTADMGDVKPHWMSWVAVDDVDVSAAKVTELGGSVCVPPTDIPNTGRFCVINDPTGATISLITLKGKI